MSYPLTSTVTLWGVVLRKKARDRDRKQE